MNKFTHIKTWFVVLLVTGCGGCVSRISMSEQSPTPSYQSKERTVVSIIDKRDSTKIGNPLNYIGGIAAGIDDNSSSSLMVYPLLTGSTKDKKITLARFLEERIIFGLMEGEWNVLPGELSDLPQNTDIINLMKVREAQKLVLIELKEWDINVNLNWGSPDSASSNLDWNINVEIIDSDAQSILKTSIKGRDVVDIRKAKDSLSNIILKTYRDRLQNIFEEPKIKEALTKNY